jgi:hypothetical protein
MSGGLSWGGLSRIGLVVDAGISCEGREGGGAISKR